MRVCVKDVMTPNTVLIAPETTLREAAEVLSAHHIGGAPVAAPGARVEGVVSASDLLDFVATSPGVPTLRDDLSEWGEISGNGERRADADEPGSWFVEYWEDAGADLLARFGVVTGPEWNVLDEHTVSEVMSRRLVHIRPDAEVGDAARRMLQQGVHRLLVMEDDRLLGVVTARDLLDLIARRGVREHQAVLPPPTVPLRPVGEIMQHQVATVPPETSLGDVARILWDEQISGVPVVDPDGRPVGFVSASDLVRYMAFGPRYRPPAGSGVRGLATPELMPLAPQHRPDFGAGRHPVTAAEVMTPATFAVRSSTSLPALARFLTNAGIHRALVMDHGRITGIVSAFDIVEEVARHAPAVEEPDELPPGDRADSEC